MSSTLRKACHACTRAKRKCVPQLPSCERCAKKEMQCSYDLEPVTRALTNSSPTPSESFPSSRSTPTSNSVNFRPYNMVYETIPAARDASAAAMADGHDPSSPAARPMIMTENEVLPWLTSFFSQVAQDGLAQRCSPFVHECIFRRELSNIETDPAQTGALARAAIEQKKTLADQLTKIHELITTSLYRLLIHKSTNKRDTDLEVLVTTMFSATKSLWSSAPTEFNESLPPFEAWILAESVRRSMFAAIFIRGLWCAAAMGYCFYEPFFESLPFDPRVGLWEARNEKEWKGALESHGDQQTCLKSFAEFVEKDRAEVRLGAEEDGKFQRLLFVSFHGPTGIRVIEEIDNVGLQKS